MNDTIERTETAKRRRIPTWARIGLAIVVIGSAAFGWWLFSPLLFDTEVDEAFPTVTTAAAATTTTPTTEGITTAGPAVEDIDEEPAGSTAASTTTTTVPAAAADPVALASGEFQDADSFHQGSGTATVYELEDGSRVLRLEDFEVTNGPDLHVFISPSGDDVMGEGYLDLGELKGNIGSQNYEIPADAELPDEFTVVIYCVPFSVVFSTAALS